MGGYTALLTDGNQVGTIDVDDDEDLVPAQDNIKGFGDNDDDDDCSGFDVFLPFLSFDFC